MCLNISFVCSDFSISIWSCLCMCVTPTDINECELRDACQHECLNTPGSHRCLCPTGYRLTTNGKTCQGENHHLLLQSSSSFHYSTCCNNDKLLAVSTDIDECLEQNIQCGANQMCFNMRGSYQCIDTPCPPNYQRDPATGYTFTEITLS